MTRKKWMTYSVVGLVSAGVLAGGAIVAANAMELRTGDGDVLPGGSITGRESSLLTDDRVEITVRDSTVSLVSAPEVASVPTVASAPAPSPVTSPTPVSAPTPESPASAASIASAPSN